MKVVTLLSVLALSMFSFKTLSAEKPQDPWLELITSADGDAKILAKLDTVKTGEKDISVLVQYLIKEPADRNFSVKYYKMSVSKQACDDGYGEVIFSPISKKRQDGFSAEYVEGGQSMGSYAAEHLCYSYKKKTL